MERISLEFPLDKNWLTTVRLTVGGVASLASLGMDEGEDLKLCITESLLVLMRRGYSLARLDLGVDGGVFVNVVGGGVKKNPTPSEEDDISFALLGALVEGLELVKEEDGAKEISFRFTV